MKYTMEAIKPFIVRNYKEDIIAQQLANKNDNNKQINYDLIE